MRVMTLVDDDDATNEDDWNMCKVETTFDECMVCDENVTPSAICSVDELIQDSQSELRIDGKDDEEYQEIVSPSFQNAVNCTEVLKCLFY